MNIFILDIDHQKCAEYHCDKHICKMILESNQILGSIAYTARGINKKTEITPEFIQDTFQGFPRKDKLNNILPYGIGFKNHPCTRWAASSRHNYSWLVLLNLELCKEYTKRYKRIHSGEAIAKWYSDNRPVLPILGQTDFVQAMPEDCKVPGDAPAAYRKYYVKHKARFAKWAHSSIPEWFTTMLTTS